jgi:hypothetical protein
MAGLPNYDDIKKTAKCIVPTLKTLIRDYMVKFDRRFF